MVYNSAALNSYQKAQLYDEIDPNKLILMLYEGAIKRIKLAKQGIETKDPKLRGENLGKAIAIISELNASLDTRANTEEILFLKSLYQTMLVELPKVSVTNDIMTLDRADRYLAELKKIWETTVMAPHQDIQKIHQKNANSHDADKNSTQYYAHQTQQRHSFAV